MSSTVPKPANRLPRREKGVMITPHTLLEYSRTEKTRAWKTAGYVATKNRQPQQRLRAKSNGGDRSFQLHISPHTQKLY